MCFVSSQKKRGEEFHASRETSQQAYIYQKKKKDAEKSVNRKKEKERRNKQTKCRRKKKRKTSTTIRSIQWRMLYVLHAGSNNSL
jgi:hypothetical protein